MKMMVRLLLLFTIFFGANAIAQGDNYILFSTTGDTMITRTSCYCKKKDTLSSHFVVLKNIQSNLQLISGFAVEEPGKNSIPCANYSLVSKDTLEKYNLTVLGQLGVYPKRKLHIKSKVLNVEKADSNIQGYLYKRRIRHKFKVGWRTFHVDILNDLTIDKKAKIEQPKIKNVFGNQEIDRYYIMIITRNEFINSDTGKMNAINAHEKIIK